jgi:hypothetical protein
MIKRPTKKQFINNLNFRTMKKILFTTFAVAVIAVAAGLNVMQSRSEIALSDVALANVEALAYEISYPGGGPIYCCASSGYCTSFDNVYFNGTFRVTPC